jgi:hypothetical protein
MGAGVARPGWAGGSVRGCARSAMVLPGEVGWFPVDWVLSANGGLHGIQVTWE